MGILGIFDEMLCHRAWAVVSFDKICAGVQEVGKEARCSATGG